MSAVSLAFRLIGVDAGASDSLDDVADSADDAAESVEGVGAAVDETSSRLEKLKAVGVAAGAAIIGAFGAGLISTLDIEPAIDKMNADLGATGQFAADLGGIAGQLYADAYGESFADVTAAIGSVVKSGAVMEDASNDQIQSVTATAMDLATVMGEDVGPVMKAVGQLIKTGLAKNAEEAFDLIARGQQQGLNGSEDLLDTIGEYGTQFRKLGLDGQTALGLISQGLRGGARDADIVADAFKEFSIRAIDGSEGTAEGFKALGLNAGEMAAKIASGGPAAAGALDLTLDKLNAIADPVARNTAGVALFGTQWEDMGAAMQSLDVSSAAAGLGDVSGAAAGLGQTLNDNAKTNLTSFKRHLEIAFVETIGGKVLPAISSAASWLTANFGPALDTAKGKLGEFFSAGTGKDLLSGLGDLGGGFVEKAMPGLKSFGDYITGSLWPALKDLGAIALRLWDDLEPAVALVGGVLLGAFSALGWVVANVLGPALRGITGFVKDNQTWITALAIAAGVGVVAFYGYAAAVTAASWATYLWASRTVLMGAAMRAVQGVMAVMRVAVLALNAAFWANPIGLIILALVALAAGFAYLWNRSESFRNFWISMWEGIKTAALAVARAFVAAWNGVVDFFSALPGRIMGFFSNVGGWLLDVGKKILGGLWTGIKWYWDNVLSRFYIDLPLMILGFLADAGSWLLDVGKKILGGLWTGVKWWWDNVLSRFYIDLPLMILGFFATAGSWLLDVGKKILSGLWDGIKWIWDNVLSRFYIDLPLKILGFFATAVSWLFDKGKDILSGLLNGLWDVAKGIGGWLWDHLYSPVIDFFRGAPDWLFDKGKELITGLYHGITDVMGGVVGWLRTNVYDRIVNAIKDLFGIPHGSAAAMIPYGREIIEGILHGIIFESTNIPGVLKKTLGNVFDVVGGVGGKLFDTIFGGDVGHLAGPKGAIQAYAMALLQAYGWGNQWRAFNALEMGEAGWNYRAVNPSSGAYGLAQILPAAHGYPVGLNDWAGQLRWMMNYIRDRYGTPTAAYAKWLSRSPHWYAEGGIFLHPSIIGVGEAGPEAVVPLNRAGKFGGGETHYHVHLSGTVVLGGSRDRAGKELRDLFRDSLRGDGKHEQAAML